MLDGWILDFGLAPHPEGGHYRETFRAPSKVSHPGHGRARSASTGILYALPEGGMSALHRVASDEVWHHHQGGAVSLHRIDEDGVHTVVTLGPSPARGHVPHAVVAAGVWQAAVAEGPGPSLCGCTVAPGFDFEDFEMPPRAVLLARFPMHAALVTRLTRDP